MPDGDLALWTNRQLAALLGTQDVKEVADYLLSIQVGSFFPSFFPSRDPDDLSTG